MKTWAQRLADGDAALAAELGRALLVPRRDNFVARPWGGSSLRRFKRCATSDDGADGERMGEAFEIAACDTDPEAARYPSRLPLGDGSEIELARLLASHGERLLGPRFVARHGACFPLLPKTLDVAELLSVQGHPVGHTECYVVIDAEPGATIRLGFASDVDGDVFGAALEQGIARQRALLRSIASGRDAELQPMLKPWLADRNAAPEAVRPKLEALLGSPGEWPSAARLLAELKSLYWVVLDSLNVIPVRAGQIIHNATPERLRAGSSREPSAEVHALGNPEGREMLLLEVRRPGTTLRAWDNVRFPPREVDVAATLAALNLRRTEADDFIVAPVPVEGRTGVFRSIDSAYFRVEHLCPDAGRVVTVPAEDPHSLHVIAGEATVRDAAGQVVGRLARGDSALVPIGIGAYTLGADGPAEIVKAGLPS